VLPRDSVLALPVVLAVAVVALEPWRWPCVFVRVSWRFSDRSVRCC
jgi:hypothetical protein